VEHAARVHEALDLVARGGEGFRHPLVHDDEGAARAQHSPSGPEDLDRSGQVMEGFYPVGVRITVTV
jgi:hypothetical protein